MDSLQEGIARLADAESSFEERRKILTRLGAASAETARSHLKEVCRGLGIPLPRLPWSLTQHFRKVEVWDRAQEVVDELTRKSKLGILEEDEAYDTGELTRGFPGRYGVPPVQFVFDDLWDIGEDADDEHPDEEDVEMQERDKRTQAAYKSAAKRAERFEFKNTNVRKVYTEEQREYNREFHRRLREKKRLLKAQGIEYVPKRRVVMKRK